MVTFTNESKDMEFQVPRGIVNSMSDPESFFGALRRPSDSDEQALSSPSSSHKLEEVMIALICLCTLVWSIKQR